MKEKILSAILQLDIYGTNPRFTINGEKKFNTYFGSFMTIISYSIIFLFFCMYTLDVINHSKPKLITTIYSDSYPLERIITSKNFVITLSLQYSNYSNFINEKIYKIEAGLYIYNNGDETEKRTSVEVIKCSEFNFEIIPSYFKSLDLDNLYCLKNGTFIIEGEYQSDSFQYLYFTFSKCDNSTSNNTCYSEEIINHVLSGGYIGIFMSDKVVIPNNFSIPYQTYGKNLFTTYSLQQFSDYWIYFKPIEIFTDSGLFFPNSKKETFIAFDRAENIVDHRESTNFANIGLRESTKREVYERSYTKIQEAAANAGGIVKIVTLIGNAIVYYFRKILYRNFMIQFFKFNKSDIKKNHQKIDDTQSFIWNQKNKNLISPSRYHNINSINYSKYNNLGNHYQNRNYPINSKIQNKGIRNLNSLLSLNQNHLNNSNIKNNSNINNNSNVNNNSNINNTNNNILNNSNNANNISNKVVPHKKLSRISFNSKIQRRETNISIISFLKTMVKSKNLENKIFTVKSSRNCFSIIFRKGCVRHIKYINNNYSKIEFLFDIVQFFKTKFEVMLIKNKIFDEGERDKLSHLYKFNYDFDADKEGYDIFYKKKDPTIYSSRSSQLKFKNNIESINDNKFEKNN